MVDPGGGGPHAVLGVVFIAGSIWAFVHPLDAFYELAAILGSLLLLKGSFDIAVAFMTREVNDLCWLGLAVGILEVFLAFWASQQLFAPRAALILVWVGFAAMFRGFTEIFLAFEVRRLAKELSEAQEPARIRPRARSTLPEARPGPVEERRRRER